MYRRASNLQWAKGEALPQVVELVKRANYRAAFPLAQKARKYIPQDRTLLELWPRISKEYSITTTPAGAQIWCREYSAMEEPWQSLGRSPLERIVLPQCMYHWKIEKEGFATHECVRDDSFTVRLREKDPAGEMVWIDAFTVAVPADASGQSRTVEAPAYLMDKYEVANEQYQAFADGGGYSTPQYWQGLRFLKDGRELDWAEAVAYFRDRTGRPGPSTWAEGTYPAGQGRHPVSGVSWFEAVAYARFAAKSLPTLYHWECAACLKRSISIIPYSHFGVGGTVPVGTHPGMGHTGLCDMAGNVKEWCWNAVDEPNGPRYLLGGSYGEQTYMFTARDSRSPWDRAPTNGFRCVKYLESAKSVADGFFLPVPGLPEYRRMKPCSDEEYEAILRQFECDRTPLNAVVESLDDSSPLWRREKIAFDAAYGNERVIAYLYVPKGGRPPYQTVVYWPSSEAWVIPAFQDLPEREYTEFIITSGRALLFPVYQGMFERRFADVRTMWVAPYAVGDWFIQDVKDLRRSLDYLETRNDIDREKIAYYGMHVGAQLGSISLAVENRFQAGVLLGGGFNRCQEKMPPVMNPVNHAPRVRKPVLMVNGTEDCFYPYETSQRPLYDLLGTPEPDKKHLAFSGSGHGLLSLYNQQTQEAVLGWLDRYLGPVG